MRRFPAHSRFHNALSLVVNVLVWTLNTICAVLFLLLWATT